MEIYRNNKDDIAKVLRDQGIYPLVSHTLQGIKDRKISSFYHPIHLIIQEAEEIWRGMAQVNNEILNSAEEDEELDIEELRKYIDKVMKICENVNSFVIFSPEFSWVADNRKRLCLRYDRVFLNSGGLGPTHGAVIEAQDLWTAKRNERGPVGLELEKELLSLVDDARESGAKFIGAESANDIVFTDSTTDGIKFALDGIRFERDDEVLITDLEHDTAINLASIFYQKCGSLPVVAKIMDCLESDDLIIEKIVEKITDKTRVIIVSHVAYNTGMEIPLKRLIERCQEKANKIDNKRLLIMVDGAQACGNIPINVINYGCDFYALDGHKWLLGPEGSGMLYIKNFLEKIKQNCYFHFVVTSAFSVSEECKRALNINEKELGTDNISRIIGLGEAIKVFNNIGFNKLMDRKSFLVKRFIEAINSDAHFSITNVKDASITGMVCLKVRDLEDADQYRELVKKLQQLNVYFRYLVHPPCIRICFHPLYNSETDVDKLIGSLKLLIEGIDIHRANQKLVKEHIKNLVKNSFTQETGSNRVGGLLIYGPPGVGKSQIVEEIVKEFEDDKTIKHCEKIIPREIIKGSVEAMCERFTKKLINARKKAPSIVFLDEVNAILPETTAKEHLRTIIGDFITQYDEIYKNYEKVFFIGAVNDIHAVSYAVRDRRLRTAYFPLPSFETRLEFLQKRSRESKQPLANDIYLDQIAEATDGYSMKEMERIWTEASKLAKNSTIEQSHFEEALRLVKKGTDDEKIKYFDDLIKKFGSIVLSKTGQTAN